MPNRYYTIDALKAFGIFCIIIGHNNYMALGNYLYSFHIPLFFFVSGLLFDQKKYKTFSFFLKKKIQYILIPYFLISIILYLFWFFAGRKFGASTQMNLSPLKNLMGIFYAQGGGNENMDWGIPMWFLPCLFLVSISYFYLSKLKKPFIIVVLIVSGILGHFLSKSLNFHLPWSLDLVFTTILFYGTGHLLRNFILNDILINRVC